MFVQSVFSLLFFTSTIVVNQWGVGGEGGSCDQPDGLTGAWYTSKNSNLLQHFVLEI